MCSLTQVISFFQFNMLKIFKGTLFFLNRLIFNRPEISPQLYIITSYLAGDYFQALRNIIAVRQ